MTNETIKNPSVVTVPNPVGIDAAILKIQTALGSLSWIEKSFGRAWTMQRTVLNQKRIEPMVYQGGGEYYPALPNDALKAYSFFRVRSERKTQDYTPGMNFGSFLLQDPLDLIVWGDLKAIDPSKDYVFKEELIKDVLTKLDANPDVFVNGIWDDKVEDIYNGYTLFPEQRDLLMFPYFAFRVDITLKYSFRC